MMLVSGDGGFRLFERALIIETSGKIGQVAIANGEQILGERSLPEARRHARDLAARSAELLAEQAWRARDLAAVIVNIGPGSFTGLRVGIASAKALAFATGCALLGVPAFDAVAAGLDERAASLEIIADALQGDVYCQRFARSDGAWRSAEAIQIRPLAQWAADVRGDALIAVSGSGIDSALLPPGRGVVQAAPSCAALLRAAARDGSRYRAGSWQLEPIYLRGSSAEEKRKRETG
jgi:tRNA threonylcarbamoyladenosine biosynthesis protein TsaB